VEQCTYAILTITPLEYKRSRQFQQCMYQPLVVIKFRVPYLTDSHTDLTLNKTNF